MPRKRRYILPAEMGVMHIYSRTVGGTKLFGKREKEAFLKLLERYSSAFFVTVHEFAVMGNHFHLVISERSREAQSATKEELLRRYHILFGEDADPPVGRQQQNGRFIPDEDGGLERLRRRLGSVPRFLQEFKQRFSLWYNATHERTGYLWGSRYGCQLAERGEAAQAVAAYAGLNPVRAHLATYPEAYRWCGLGLLARDPGRGRRLLNPIPVRPGETPLDESGYRLFLYRSGRREMGGKGSIDPVMAAQVEALCGRLGFMDMVDHRIRNLREGLVLGSAEFVAGIQAAMENVNVRPRRLREGLDLFCSRVLG